MDDVDLGKMTDEEYMQYLMEKADEVPMTKSQMMEKRILMVSDELGYRLAVVVGRIMRRFGSDE